MCLSQYKVVCCICIVCVSVKISVEDLCLLNKLISIYNIIWREVEESVNWIANCT